MTDLVVVSLERWDDVWRRNQILLAGLLGADPDLRVLVVEPPADPLHALAGRRRPRRGAGLVARGRADGVPAGRLWTYQPTKWLPRRADAFVGTSADTRMAHTVLQVARRLHLHAPVLWVNDPAGATLARVSSWPSLYDITDDWLAAHRSPAQLARLRDDEDFLMATCRTVVVCSAALARTKGAIRPVRLVPNAVDLDAFRRPRARPRDLPPGRVALYAGTVHPDRVDVGLCVRLGDELRTTGLGTLVLVGPALVSEQDRTLLHDAGVQVLGPRPYATVPAYLQHADVLVVPHVVDPFTDSLDPIKLYEYQAVARPVVSTPVAGFRDLHHPAVHVLDSRAFVDGVTSVLVGPPLPPGPLPQTATIPTWAERVTEMQDVLVGLRATT
ncbi:glycosyltransferase [Sanguibacter antarcticus]|uniref:Glycosyl transferase family 1 n=1 Tax=Sanguibacter antarcticus TaxID=372484 RepID=A0A2A9E1V1_9MICO|nr:glycosyltransferase [Sanguibacter antarcticus]PFG32335.1 glycosyl transferase family 1 [Sanguibacter antarcticus]